MIMDQRQILAVRKFVSLGMPNRKFVSRGLTITTVIVPPSFQHMWPGYSLQAALPEDQNETSILRRGRERSAYRW